MFDAIGDMPLHPLVIHAVVIGVPLAVLLAVLFAIPRTRTWARWPLAVVSVGSLVSTFVAKESGEALERALGIESGNPVGDLIEQHSALADQLFIIMIAFTIIALANVVLVRAPRGDSTEGGRKALALVLPLLLVVVGVVAAIWIFRVGDIGARAVWNPTGDAQYSVEGGR